MEKLEFIYQAKRDTCKIILKGEINLKRICNLYREIFSNKLVPVSCKRFLLVDEGDMELSAQLNYKFIDELIAQYGERLKGCRVAICLSDPRIYAIVFNLKLKYPFPVHRPFACKKDAYEWLERPF